MGYVSPYQNLAETYEAIRPGYPEALLEDIIAQTALAPPGPLLEIGAGTGKATKAFLARGFTVDAVEPDADMAALLKRKLHSPDLQLFVSPFESWEPPRSNYPMIYCAQAFHWLDGKTKFARCAELLVEHGYLVLFWYDPLPPVNSPAYRVSEQVKAQYFGSALPAKTVSLDTRERELRETKEFELVFRRQYNIMLHNTPEQALAAMASTPAFSAVIKKLPKNQQQAFLEDFTAAIEENGGSLDAPMQYSLYLLRRK